ncbi:hypothetical protein [Bdellovibrio svalbardensis]|uniref:Outer membrane protein beta-barrel domain-containing protein n=1 Tax=Bdellovibrio svalbardensis TaxID=2972972 RepID=A0ABT6DNB0_9BACT|nr:hypothetical protein [Bdellovibrio svalbardensis]MDG0817997.1 hypothetical protein [Bdellovibrio svalbardensis]
MKLFFIASLLISSTSFAQSTSVSSSSKLSLREQAAAETRVEGQTQKNASDAQLDATTASGMLSLKDPRPEVITRTWQYFAGLTAQSFTPRGIVSTDSVGNFDLSENGSTFMPGLAAGFLSPEMKTKALLWRVGLRGNAAFSSQEAAVRFPTGYTVSDARLNSTLFAFGPTVSLQWDRLQWLALTFTPQYGTVNYTQTSANEFAHFSKQTGYMSLNFGLDFQFSKQWSIFTEYSQRSLRDSYQELALQRDNFGLGTKVTW